jgi:hypothetical protein
MQRVLDDMQAYHGDADFGICTGDLVDRPTDDSTGAEYAYGFKALFADLRSRVSRIPLSRRFFLPGNHDRDGTSSHRWAWTHNSYRKEVGPL